MICRSRDALGALNAEILFKDERQSRRVFLNAAGTNGEGVYGCRMNAADISIDGE